MGEMTMPEIQETQEQLNLQALKNYLEGKIKTGNGDDVLGGIAFFEELPNGIAYQENDREKTQTPEKETLFYQNERGDCFKIEFDFKEFLASFGAKNNFQKGEIFAYLQGMFDGLGIKLNPKSMVHESIKNKFE
jgi:hypothetical protein